MPNGMFSFLGFTEKQSKIILAIVIIISLVLIIAAMRSCGSKDSIPVVEMPSSITPQSIAMTSTKLPDIQFLLPGNKYNEPGLGDRAILRTKRHALIICPFAVFNGGGFCDDSVSMVHFVSLTLFRIDTKENIQFVYRSIKPGIGQASFYAFDGTCIDTPCGSLVEGCLNFNQDDIYYDDYGLDSAGIYVVRLECNSDQPPRIKECAGCNKNNEQFFHFHYDTIPGDWQYTLDSNNISSLMKRKLRQLKP